MANTDSTATTNFDAGIHAFSGMNDFNKKSHEMAEMAEYVRGMLDVLMSALQGECPPGQKAIEDTIYAASLLLTPK